MSYRWTCNLCGDEDEVFDVAALIKLDQMHMALRHTAIERDY